MATRRHIHPPRLTRRQALRHLALGSGALLLACKSPPKAPPKAAVKPPDTAAAQRLLLASRKARILAGVAELVHEGLSHDELRAALVAAWADIDGDVHGGLVLHALFALERELMPRQRLLVLFRACDHLVDHRDAWKRRLARAPLPAALLGMTREDLVKHTRGRFDRLDGDAARLGIRALHQRWGQDVVSAELHRMAARDDGSGGHGSHGVVAAMDMLRGVNWHGADAVLDQAVDRLQPPGSWQGPPSEAARAAFAAHQRMVREIGEGWQGGVRRLEVSRALRKAARADRGEALVLQVRTALDEKVHADALWDGLALAAADMALADATPSGPGVHGLLMVAALRQSAARAPTPQARLISLLGAAWRLPGHRPATRVTATGVAVETADGATLVTATARDRRAAAIRAAAGGGGAPALAVRDGMRDLLLRKNAPDPHALELTMAATRLASVCAPGLQGEVLAAVAAGGLRASDADWPGLLEAERLAKRLRGS